ncbi:YSIRK signal domain/LPXTG anchor domain surface protein [Gemella sp. ND 6198]|nr:YSIRK signal domain/LPXTG anchor domain surface protein [Gemella sp. ND 6198]
MSLNNEKRNKWSIRRLSGVGVASVIVASSMIGGAAQVNAAELKTNKLTEVKESRDILQPKNIDEINKKLEMTGKSIKKSDMMTENSKVEKKVADNKAEPKSQDKNMKHKHEMTKPEDVKKSVSENIKDKIDVPASYLENAKYPGPFTAGVNQVIPYEAFGGDGMLTRLLLKSSDKALWSDNGTAKHPGLLPLDKLTNGHYFYNVELDGKAKGKSDKALLEQLKANGTQSYSATVKVYGSKNGKPDLSNVIATKKVTINLKGKHNHKDHNHNGHNPTDPMNKGHMGMGGHHGHHMHSSNTNQNGSQLTNSTTNQGTLSNGKTRLPNTGQSETNLTLAGIIGLIFASILGFFAIKRKNR